MRKLINTVLVTMMIVTVASANTQRMSEITSELASIKAQKSELRAQSKALTERSKALRAERKAINEAYRQELAALKEKYGKKSRTRKKSD